MRKIFKRVLSVILTVSILSTFAPAVFAEEELVEGNSYFDFEASEYEAHENDGELKIKVIRHGGNVGDVEVSFKAADFISEYGIDYEILDENNKPLEKVSGEKPDVSEFVYDEAENTDEASETAEPEETEDTEATEAEETTETAELQENSTKKSVSTGSSLLDAQKAYLNLPDASDNSETEDAVKETLNDMYSYFLTAQGAHGVIRFKEGETEKEITVKLYDNDVAESDKIFMLALMGTNTEDTMIAANATTYVTIIDDENTEIQYFDLVDGNLTLSPSAPEGYITVRRTGGTQYFSMVYISTVKSTAAEGSYEEFEGRTVAFVPGETEKQVKVTAYDFSEDAKFGIRLEGGNNTEIGNYYVDVYIASDSAAEENVSSYSTDGGDSVSLMASNDTLGSYEITPTDHVMVDKGWEAVITGSDNDNRAQVVNNSNPGALKDLYLAQYDKNKYSALVSNKAFDLTGITAIRLKLYVGGDGSKFTTGFDVDKNKKNDKLETPDGARFSVNGKVAIDWQTLNVSGINKSMYLRFWTKANAGGKQNPRASLYQFRFWYAKYTFSVHNSAENFNRQMYDFTEGTPKIYNIFYDGDTKNTYNPGSVTIKSGSNTVSAFYGNNTSSVTISDANAAENAKRGIYLKGVYFCQYTSPNKLYNEQYKKYTTSKVCFFEADKSHNVVITPNQSFISTLIASNVLSSTNKDETIEVYPVYTQETVTVNFENADSSTGKYDINNKGSYIGNVIEGFNTKNNSVTITKPKNCEYYSMTVPVNSVIRVKTYPASNRTPAGVMWWYNSGSGSGISYYKAGETKFSGSNANGVEISETDYTMADIVADKSLSIRPATGEQTFYVGYSPKSYSNIMSSGVVTSLENAVVDTTDGYSDANNIKGTDSTGSMWLANPFIGKNYTFTAYAPNGYYTSWANMSGDADNSGTIGDSDDDDVTSRTDRLKSSNPLYVYGSKLNVQLDQDNTRYYYEFIAKNNSATFNQTGSVLRENTTFYKLAKNIKATSYTPVVGAYMNIAGFTGMTDGNGKYSIPMEGLPSWGTVSASLTVDGVEYNATASIESSTQMVLPALEKFTAKSISAKYEEETDSVADNIIMVMDDTLTIEATVAYDGAITPSGAKFYIYNSDGYQTVDCAEDSDYTITQSTLGNNFTATLEFNPKKDMAFGYKVYVQFCDQNGTWYNPIDTGYSFYAALDVESFVFPMIGSSSLENTVTTGFVADLIGNPLGDIDVGSISGLDSSISPYSPKNIPEEDKEQYSWLQTDYSFGFSKKLGSGSKSWDSNKSYESKMKEYMKGLEDGTLTEGAKAPTASKYNTQGSFKWSVTPSVGFNLKLSTRSDNNTYFEDLIFYVKVDFEVSAEQTISLPIGISIILSGGLSGDVTGIYHMYVDYKGDSYETEGAVLYDSENFGVFKKFTNNVRREGYIFINPKVSIGLEVKWAIISVHGTANFKFDMDFQFAEDDTYGYGDMTIDLDWSIELVGFTVYSKKYDNVAAVKLFSVNGKEEHINFNYEVEDTVSVALQSASDIFSEDGDLILDQPVSRDYLQNRSEWNSGGFSLMSVDAAEGTTEKTLRSGAAGDPYMSITKINDTEMLMVFVDDDTARNDVNKRAVYYSIGDGDTWSEPQLLDDDGTLDDYPDVFDLGNGKILVSWSSSDTVFDEGATVEDALKSLNIKAAFFDTQTKTFGEITQLTKTTDEDYTADVLPRAAYDSETDRLILYYTKTEYEDLELQSDIGTAASVTAYLFYENGEWSNDGSFYTDEELEGIADKDAYKEQWYGQRFLDVRINSADSEMLRVVDTDVISYNGLALFAWTVDWDKDLTTVDDRDVFLQIYNFSENSFTHNIRITSESGKYSLPKLGRTDNSTYLFYGAQDEDSDHGEIRYLDITDIISNEKYTKITNGTTEYYVLQYESPAVEYELEDGTIGEIPAEIVTAEADTAVESDNITDYDVYVNEDGKLYLFWTDTVDSTREIFAAMFNGTDSDDDDAESDSYDAYWSEPFVLTDGGDNVFYSGLGATVSGGVIYIGSGKAVYNDESSSELVLVKHIPYANVVMDSIELGDEYPAEGGNVEVKAAVKNEGMLPSYDDVTVTFEMNGEVIGSQTVNTIPGGETSYVSVYAELPEDISDMEFTAYIDKDSPVSVKVEQKAELELNSSAIEYLSVDYDNGTPERYAYLADVENSGNKAFGEIQFTLSCGDTEVGAGKVESLEAGESAEIDITLDIPDTLYDIDEDGKGTAEITIEIVSDGETINSFEETAVRYFDADAIALLEQVTDVVFENSGIYTLEAGDEVQIQPTIEGVGDGQLKVEWLSSSDGSVVSIDYSNTILASSAGTAVLTGILVPYEDMIAFDCYGNSETTDWRDLIPSENLITVTATVSVTDIMSGAIDSDSDNLTVTVKTEDIAEDKAVLIAASYDDSGAVKDVIIIEVDLSESEGEELSLEIPMEKFSDAGSIQLFLWKDLAGMEPICNSVTIGK